MKYTRASNNSLFLIGNEAGEIAFALENGEKISVDDNGISGLEAISPQEKTFSSNVMRLESVLQQLTPRMRWIYTLEQKGTFLFDRINWNIPARQLSEEPKFKLAR